jgi:hypothetical protein
MYKEGDSTHLYQTLDDWHVLELVSKLKDQAKYMERLQAGKMPKV